MEKGRDRYQKRTWGKQWVLRVYSPPSHRHPMHMYLRRALEHIKALETQSDLAY
jgi:hypothetical protein